MLTGEGDDVERTLKLDTRSQEVGMKKEVIGESDSDEDAQFEKHFKQEMSFVMAKFMVKKKKVGFVCDTNNTLVPLRGK